MPQTVKKMQKINIKYLNDIELKFIIIFYIFFYGLKYKKSLPPRVKDFLKIGHFLGHFYFAFYALSNLVFVKCFYIIYHHKNINNALMIISLPFFKDIYFLLPFLVINIYFYRTNYETINAENYHKLPFCVDIL
jgi:hypothetical protein